GVLGQNGGSVADGWNAPNRVVLTRNAQPGEKFQIAVFGINGPVSTHPDTYIWVRSATLDFYSPFGLPKFGDDPRREQPHSGVYSVKDGTVQLVSTDFTGPNGLAFSPDEKFLYIGDRHTKRAEVNRYPVNANTTLRKGALF